MAGTSEPAVRSGCRRLLPILASFWCLAVVRALNVAWTTVAPNGLLPIERRCDYLSAAIPPSSPVPGGDGSQPGQLLIGFGFDYTTSHKMYVYHPLSPFGSRVPGFHCAVSAEIGRTCGP